MIKKLPKECYEDDYNDKLNEIIDVVNRLIPTFEGDDLELVLKKADYLMTTDAEGYSIGAFVRKMLTPFFSLEVTKE